MRRVPEPNRRRCFPVAPIVVVSPTNRQSHPSVFLTASKPEKEALVPAFLERTGSSEYAAGRGEREGPGSPRNRRGPSSTPSGIRDPTLDYASLEQVRGPIQIICRDHRLTPYDALYIELALRSGCPLATLGSTATPSRDLARHSLPIGNARASPDFPVLGFPLEMNVVLRRPTPRN